MSSSEESDSELINLLTLMDPVQMPPLRDDLETETSHAQDAVVRLCLPLLAADGDGHATGSAKDGHGQGLPRLQREKHVNFLKHTLGQLPPGFVAVDASRPWMLYWALMGLHLLGEDVSCYRERYST